MNKVRIPSKRRRRQIADAFLDAMVKRDNFLLLGHKNPDEDCISSMVAFGLLLTKFNRNATIVFNKENWDKFPYLLSICKYNSIEVLGAAEEITGRFDTLVACDTPKPDMIDFHESLQPLMDDEDVLVLEIDHHLEADGQYIGQEGYCLVDEASSTCELVGYLALRLVRNSRLMTELGIGEVFTRNFVLAIVTGIVGDSKMGQFLKSRREKRYYRYFSRLFNRMLIRKTDKDSGNFSSIQDILNELEALSDEEERCFNDFITHLKKRKYIAWIAMDEMVMNPLREKYDNETIVTMAKYTTNLLAEESGYVGLMAYYDYPEKSDLIQLRMRRSSSYKNLDLRRVIAHFEIENGGGHEGAVGFRVPKLGSAEFESFIKDLVDGTSEMIQALE